MQVFALGILVIQLAARDGSLELAPFYLGLMGLARAIPGLALTLIAGVADRSDPARCSWCPGVMSVNASVLALVTLLVRHAVARPRRRGRTIGGVRVRCAGRTRCSPRLVPPRAVASAIGLQSAAFNGAQVIGPLAAGLCTSLCVGGLLIINAASFTVILFALIAMKPIRVSASRNTPCSPVVVTACST